MKKHMYRPIAATLLALVMALGLTACGNEGGDATTAEMTPAQVMEKSQEVMAEVKSLHYDMDMSFGMSMQEQSMNVESNMSVDYILDPMAMKMDMHMTLGEMGDKIPEGEKAPVQAAIDKLKETLKGEDTAAIKADTEALQQAFYAVSEKLYQQAGGPQAGPDMGGQPGGGQAEGQQYYDADYKVVDEDDQSK